MTHPYQKPDLTDIGSIVYKLRNETNKEHIYLIKRGKAIAWFEGNIDNVNPPQEQLIRFKDCLVLHNHPNGTSFSLDDVEIAIENDIKEMRIITANNTFILKRPANGWNIDFKNSEVEKLYNELLQEMEATIEYHYSKGEMTGSEKKFIINHWLWLIFFPKFGIEYKRY